MRSTVLTGLPENRPDLQDIDRLLAQLPLRVTYRPIDLSPLGAAPPSD